MTNFSETVGDKAEQQQTMNGARRTWRRAGPAVPDDIEAPYLSEQWLALGFVAVQSQWLRYTALWNQWHIWEGTRWQRDDKLRAFSLAAGHCREIAQGLRDGPGRSITKAKVRAAVVSLARENPTLAMASKDWDADDWNFNTGGNKNDD